MNLRLTWLPAALVLLGGAVPATAAPIFTTATLDPAAISPNGDLVQDFTQIAYTLDVDSADVRVVLAATPGGSVVGTLQFFTRQGRGVRSLAFDGTVGGTPVPDGTYTVQILGVGTQGQGSEQRNLALIIDRVAPTVTEVSLVTPAQPVVQDGVTLVVQACVAGAPDSVFADFSALDTGWNPLAVTAAPVGPDCRRFTYTLTLANAKPDADNLPVVVTALDRAGNRARRELPLCLSNTPPLLVSAFLVGFPDSVPIYRNGDVFQIEAKFTSPYPLTVGADFSALDSGFRPDSVLVDDLGGQRFRLTYRITEGNTRADRTYPLVVFAEDPGCGRAATDSLHVVLDNASLFAALIRDVTATPPAFSPNGDGAQDETIIGFTVIEDTVIVIITTIVKLTNQDPVLVSILSSTHYPRGRHEVHWAGPPLDPARVRDQVLDIQVRGVVLTPPEGLVRDVMVQVELDKTPPQFVSFQDASRTPLKNGDLVNLSVKYDRPRYRITGDFSSLDSGFNPQTSTVAAVDSGGGRYGVFYAVSPSNSRPDGTNLPVSLTATDEAGNRTTTSGLVRVCLSNLPPRFVRADLSGDKTSFREGDRIELFARWVGGLRPLSLTADFSALDSDFEANKVAVVDRTPTGSDTAVFEVAYTLTTSNDNDTGEALPIVLTAYDAAGRGCGRTPVTALRVNLDSVRPPTPTLSTPAQVVRASTALLTGIALEAVRIVVKRGEETVDTLVVDIGDASFSGEIPLRPGENTFTVESIDAAGNLSRPSKAVTVLSVQGNFLSAPGPFTPGAEFFLGFVQPMARLSLWIMNLEGVELARLDVGAGDLYRVPWDGKDEGGTLLASGPYLVVAEAVPASGGGTLRLRQAFVFTRRAKP